MEKSSGVSIEGEAGAGGEEQERLVSVEVDFNMQGGGGFVGAKRWALRKRGPGVLCVLGDSFVDGEEALCKCFVSVMVFAGKSPHSVECMTVNGAVGLDTGWIVEDS